MFCQLQAVCHRVLDPRTKKPMAGALPQEGDVWRNRLLEEHCNCIIFVDGTSALVRRNSLWDWSKSNQWRHLDMPTSPWQLAFGHADQSVSHSCLSRKIVSKKMWGYAAYFNHPKNLIYLHPKENNLRNDSEIKINLTNFPLHLQLCLTVNKKIKTIPNQVVYLIKP